MPRWHEAVSLTVRDYQQYGLFDLLFVDGPASLYHRRAALPTLQPYLSESAVIVLDDGNHSVTQETVNTWLKAQPSWQAHYYDTLKGTYVLWSKTHPWALPLP
jgi:predicted O-methyltransferase YrrM